VVLADAVLREIAEETGLTAVTLGAALAVQQRPHPLTGQPRVTVFFHARTTGPRDAWTRTVAGPEGDEDHAWSSAAAWFPWGEAVGLPADWHGEFVALTADVRRRRCRCVRR
jgi:ADP-ribose pyrophosphatase YjhB (NUDIX family)